MRVLAPLIVIAVGVLVIWTLVWMVIWLIEYGEHITETIRDERIIYDWATFKQFAKRFKECDEIYLDITDYGNGMISFCRYKEHCKNWVNLAGTIQFNGSYMILYPWSWIRCKFLLWRYCAHKATRQKGLWRN